MITQEIIDKMNEDYRTSKCITVTPEFYNYMQQDSRCVEKYIGSFPVCRFNNIPVIIDRGQTENYIIKY